MSLETLQKEAREEYDSMLFNFTIEGAHANLDSLTKKAYLQGIRDAKDCLPEKIDDLKVTKEAETGRVPFGEKIWNLCRKETLEAITRLEETV